jgi:hypothetical protein
MTGYVVRIGFNGQDWRPVSKHRLLDTAIRAALRRGDGEGWGVDIVPAAGGELSEDERLAWDRARDGWTLPTAAAILGAKGGAAGRGESKRRDVDYAALGRKGGQAGKGKRKPRE